MTVFLWSIVLAGLIGSVFYYGEYTPLFTPNPLRSVFWDDINGDERTDVRSLSAIFPLNMVRYRLLRGKKGKAAVVLAAYPCVA